MFYIFLTSHFNLLIFSPSFIVQFPISIHLSHIFHRKTPPKFSPLKKRRWNHRGLVKATREALAAAIASCASEKPLKCIGEAVAEAKAAMPPRKVVIFFGGFS